MWYLQYPFGLHVRIQEEANIFMESVYSVEASHRIIANLGMARIFLIISDAWDTWWSTWSWKSCKCATEKCYMYLPRTHKVMVKLVYFFKIKRIIRNEIITCQWSMILSCWMTAIFVLQSKAGQWVRAFSWLNGILHLINLIGIYG